MSLRRLVLFSAVALALFPVSSARASLVAYDGFDSYTSGGSLNLGNGGTGWTSAWNANPILTLQTGVLTYSNGSVVVNGGTQFAQIGGTGDTTDDLTDAADRTFADQTGTLYFSFLFNAGTSSLASDDFLHFMLNNDTSNAGSGGIGDLSTGSVKFGARVGTTNGGLTTVESGVSITANTTFFLVGKITKTATNYSRMDLFVNPSSQTEPVPSATQTGDTGFSSLPYFTLRTFNLDSDDVYGFDELRVGTTFADVVPTPEPGSAILMGIGALGLLARRRR